METITYSDLLGRVKRKDALLRPGQFSDDDELVVRDGLAEALEIAWEHYPWPEVVRIDELTVAADLLNATPWYSAVMGIWKADPEVYPNAPKINYALTHTGILLEPEAAVPVYVQYKALVPKLEGDDLVEGTGYAVGDRVYDDTTGDFYLVIQATTGVEEVTDTDYFERVEIPRFFALFMVEFAYAFWLRSKQRIDEADRRELRAYDHLYDKVAVLQGQSKQTKRYTARNPYS